MTHEPPADRERHRYIHSIRPKYGTYSHNFVALVEAFARSIGARSLLDYGCGKALLGEGLVAAGSKIEIQNYDPGLPQFDAPPVPADLVVCTDVLPLIGLPYLDGALDHMQRLARLGVYIIIPFHPDRRIPEHHANVIRWPEEKWKEVLATRWPGMSFAWRDTPNATPRMIAAWRRLENLSGL